MKSVLRTISFTALILTVLSTYVAAQASSQATIENDSANNLGNVELFQSANGPVFVNVPGQGTYTVGTTADITWVVINGQGVPQGGTGTISLPSGASVKVTLSGSAVVVIDQNVVQ